VIFHSEFMTEYRILFNTDWLLGTACRILFHVTCPKLSSPLRGKQNARRRAQGNQEP
jgi:hypothetical protein